MTDQWSGFTVSVRTPTGKQEREGQASWQELPIDQYGHYPKTLWLPTSQKELLRPDIDQADTLLKEGVFIYFFTPAGKEKLLPGQKGVAIVSQGMAEVYCGDIKLLSRETAIIRDDDGVILIPAQAYDPGGRAEILFDEPGQTVKLQIKIGEQTVREVKIVNQ